MQRNLLTISRFSERNPSFTEPSLRWLIFNSELNGMVEQGAVVRLGRRVYIDADKFFAWVDSRGNAPLPRRQKSEVAA